MNAIRTGPIRAGCAVMAGWMVPLVALALAPGDSADRVIAELGPPPNALTIGTRQIYDYDLGRVEIENGVVIQADLLSEAEAAERRRRLEDAAAAAAAQAWIAERQRRDEGQAVLARQFADPRFLASSAAERAAFLRRFSARYPEVSVDREYRQALWEAEQELNQGRAAVAAAADAARAREIDQVKLDVLEARLRTLEAEAAARSLPPSPPAPAPSTVVNVNVEVPYLDTYYLPATVRVPEDPAPLPSSRDTWGRYSISRRLPPIGTPTFGGAPPAPR